MFVDFNTLNDFEFRRNDIVLCRSYGTRPDFPITDLQTFRSDGAKLNFEVISRSAFPPPVRETGGAWR